MAEYPYLSEPTHKRGTITNDASNGARDTAVYDREGTSKLDISDSIFLIKFGQAAR